MYCRNCGKELKEGKQFCVYCGAPVKTASLPAQPDGNTAKPPVKAAQAAKQASAPVRQNPKQNTAPAKRSAAQKSRAAAPAAPKKAKKKGHAGLIVVLCLIAVLIVGGVFAFLHFFPFTGKGNTDSKDGTATAAGSLNAFESACRDADGTEVLALMTDYASDTDSKDDTDEEASDGEEPENTFTMDDLYEEFGEDFVNEALGVTSEQEEAEAEETGDSEAADFMESGSLLSAILEHSEVTVEAGEENAVTVSLTVPDLYTYLTETNCLEECETSEDTYNALLELLDSGELGTKDYEFETVMTETDEGWRLVCTSDMLDGFYGGLLTYYAELYVSSYYAAFQYIAEGGTGK